MESNGKIVIGKPWVESRDGKCFLFCDIDMNGDKKRAWFSVGEEHGKYLCHERSDAFLIACLPYAQRNGLDIICEHPVTSRLSAQLSEFLVPALSKYDESMYPSKIHCQTDDSSIRTGKEVGTSGSLGVDSMHAIMKFSDSGCDEFRITKIFLANVGAYHINPKCYSGDIKRASAFCQKYGYSLMVSNSNVHKVLRGALYRHIYNYALSSSVYAVQKAFRTYVFPGSHTFPEFTLNGNRNLDDGHQQLFVLDMLSHGDLKIMPEGLHLTRAGKLAELKYFTPSAEFLHVCGHMSSINCGRCEKCRRTKRAMREIGVMDMYSHLFRHV